MKTMTKTLAKGTLGTVAAGALALTSATPAMADDHRDGGISAGDVIAGAVIIGGIAAIAAAVGNDRDDYRYRDGYRYRDNYRYNDHWRVRGNPRSAVERCISAVERDARRAGYRFADVTQIRDVDDTRYGWRVRGNLVVDGDRYRNNGWGRYDRYDRNDRYRRSDSGRFDCRIDRGRVYDVDYSGIRGLR